MVMASNAMEQVESGCDDVVFIRQGRLVDQGSVQYFLDRYGGPETVVLTILAEDRPGWPSSCVGTPSIEGIAPHLWHWRCAADRVHRACVTHRCIFPNCPESRSNDGSCNGREVAREESRF